MSLLDDWLKPTVDEDHGREEDDPMGVGNPLSASDLQLPDLGLSDIKWWVDLEFLDLASGPPANFNSGQDRNRAKNNPTLGYHFPDIFFDSTAGQGSSSAASLFGSAGDDSHRCLISDSFKDHGLDFEKGLLADLFPASAGPANDDKLLEDIVGDITETGANRKDKNDEAADANEEEVVKDQQDSIDSVLQTISKNFSDFSATIKDDKDKESNRVLRIRSIRTNPGPAAGEEETIPEGTVARIAIRSNRRANTTTFTIVPSGSSSQQAGPQQSFRVNTHNLSKATQMIKPLHLDKLPVFKDLFRIQERTKPLEEDHPEKLQKKRQGVTDAGVLEAQLLQDLADHGVNLEGKKVLCSRQNNKFFWTCPDCQKEFDRPSVFKVHLFGHHGIKPFKCLEAGCTWSFLTQAKLNRHRDSHDKLKRFACTHPGCHDRSFSTAHNLQTHMKGHTDPPQNQCPQCPQAFRNKRALEAHLKRHHGLLPHPCLVEGCGKRFFRATDLSRHTAIHSRLPKDPYSCDICDKTFQKPSQLKVHMTVHTGDRPYVCQYAGCSWAFRTSSKLRRHERTHKNLRNSVCGYCDKSYLRPEHLKEHVASVHGNVRFACPIATCETRFAARASLYVHLKQHRADPDRLGGGKFRCVFESCCKQFQSRRNLASHVGQEHKPDMLASSEVAGDTGIANHEQSELAFVALLASMGDELLCTSSCDSSVQCGHCSEAYVRPEELMQHVASVHGNVRLACPVATCEVKFAAVSMLCGHLKQHQANPDKLGGGKFRCVVESCCKQFQNSRDLTSHFGQEHKPDTAASSGEVGDAGISRNEHADLLALLPSLGETAILQKDESNKPLDFAQLISETVECPLSPQPKDLITVDTSAITPVKNITVLDSPLPAHSKGNNKARGRAPRKRAKTQSLLKASQSKAARKDRANTQNKGQAERKTKRRPKDNRVDIPQQMVVGQSTINLSDLA